MLIGEKCVLMEGSLVENHSILAPGTVLPPGRLVPSGQLWAGNPAKFVRNLTKDEVRVIRSRQVMMATESGRLLATCASSGCAVRLLQGTAP